MPKLIIMKNYLRYFLFSSVFVLSAAVFADTQDKVASTVYLIELLIMGVISLALIIVFISIVKDRKRHSKKMELFDAEMEHRKTIAQLLMCSVQGKAQNITRVSGLLNAQFDETSKHEAKVEALSDNKPMRPIEGEPKTDPRNIAADGSAKQAHLGKDNYVACMLDMHLEGLCNATEVEETLKVALSDAQEVANNNLQELTASLQSLTNTIDILELEKQGKNNTKSNHKTLEELINIRNDFDELVLYQQQNKGLYEGFSSSLQQNKKNSVINGIDEVLTKEYCPAKQHRA